MSFAPYQPPPDLPKDDAPSSSKSQPKRPWFSRDPSSTAAPSGAGYQSGGSLAGGGGSTSYSSVPSSSSAAYAQGGGSSSMADESATPASSWETRFGFRVDVEAAMAYIFGPIGALALLILETSNDFVRFHAYQSALLTTPMVVLHFLFSLLFWRWLSWIYTIAEIVVVVFMAYRAFADGNRGLERFYLPVIGDLAERWVSDE